MAFPAFGFPSPFISFNKYFNFIVRGGWRGGSACIALSRLVCRLPRLCMQHACTYTYLGLGLGAAARRPPPGCPRRGPVADATFYC
jgi:hypothetical protein